MRSAERTDRSDTLEDFGIQEVDITLIRPTNYTDDGYPIRTRLGVIRSNTLTQMGTLARDIANYPFFKPGTVFVRQVDEAVERVPWKEIINRSGIPGVKSIVMLVGVQTNQFPRALDLADQSIANGIPVMIGGFHVSGMFSMIGLTADLRAALSKGIILVAGEVEGGRLTAVVQDVISGSAQPMYDFLNPTADLSDLPIPRLSKSDFKHFASPYSTIDTGRGCVFTCDFCTIINVQGRTMRCRDPKQVVEYVRLNYHNIGIRHSFFTDDNLARNPRWRELFAGLIHLREEEQIPFTFMMQSDLAARKMPGGDFFTLAARAGCNQVFLGVESVNRENLRSVAKFQNQIAEYKNLVAHCRSLGITAHAGYIVGFPFDTPAGIAEDIHELQRIGFGSASFYVLAPLPGSKDHQTWWRQRRWMDPDFNKYDSAHVAVLPDRMTADELMHAYRDTWEQFYSTEYMIEVLKQWRSDWGEYWGRLFFFAAYLYASRVEGLHPMNCGFWTLRYRDDRRSGFPRESFIPFWLGRARATAHRIHGLVTLFFQFEEVWLRSRPQTHIEEALRELIAKSRQDLVDSKSSIIDWRDIKVRELHALYKTLHAQIPETKVPNVVALWFRKRNPFHAVYTRSHFQRFWSEWYRRIWNPLNWVEMGLFESYYGVRFLRYLLTNGH